MSVYDQYADDWHDAEDEHEAFTLAHQEYEREQRAKAESEWEQHTRPMNNGFAEITMQRKLFMIDGVRGIVNSVGRTVIDLSHNVPADLKGM